MMYNQRRKTVPCPGPCHSGKVYSDGRTKQYFSAIYNVIVCDECAFEEKLADALQKVKENAESNDN